MEENNFASKFESLDDIVDNYYKENVNWDHESAQILAIKKVMELKSSDLKIKYLGEDRFLDFLNYSKNFENEKEKYEEDFHSIFFDREVPDDKLSFLERISEMPRMFNRLIASRISREMSDELWEKYSNDITVYSLASNYIGFNYSKEEKELIIRGVIEDVITNCNDKDMFKILGEEGFLSYISCKNKLEKGNLEELSDQISLFISDKPLGMNNQKYFDVINGIIDKNKNNIKEKILSEFLRANYYPVEGLYE